jgi:serine/threonine protein phosphatase 1
MKYYVVSDVHGYYKYLMTALGESGFFEEKKPHKLVVCGDLLDRGDEANELIDFMVKLLEDDKLIYILGNHEESFVECMQEIADGDVYEIACGMSHHYTNKTWDSLLQIAKMDMMSAYNDPNELLRRVRQSPFYKKLLPACIDYYETQNYIFTHGWIPCAEEGRKPYLDYSYDPNWRDADDTRWYDARWYNGISLACKYNILELGKTIVCGHWHASYGHSQIEKACSEWGEDAIFTPFVSHGIIAIDACTARSKRVNCIVIDD